MEVIVGILVVEEGLDLGYHTAPFAEYSPLIFATVHYYLGANECRACPLWILRVREYIL
jgi:hypothetical protein